MSSLIDLLGLSSFKDLLLEQIKKELAGKQDAGEYLTQADIDTSGYVKCQSYGDVRVRDESKPTYGIEVGK